MKILVTGGAGFIGSHVVDAFLAAGHDVAVVDNLWSGRRSNLNPRARFYEVDIRSPQLREVFEQEQPDIVDHHAAQMDVRKSVVDPLFDADVNVKGSVNLLELSRAYGVKKVIYISTGGAVYGEPEYLPCDENHPVNPICQYGVSKHVVEHYLYVYRHLYGLDYGVLRYPNVYGAAPNPHGRGRRWCPSFPGTNAWRGQPVKNLPGTASRKRNFVLPWATCPPAPIVNAWPKNQTGGGFFKFKFQAKSHSRPTACFS